MIVRHIMSRKSTKLNRPEDPDHLDHPDRIDQLKAEQEAFRSWLQKNLDTAPSQKTLHNKGRLLKTFVSTYGLDLKNPDPYLVAGNISKADVSARTKKTYKTALKQYLEFKGIEITDDLKQALKHQLGQRVRKTHPKDLVTREELEDIVEHTTSLMLRAYFTVLWDTGARPGALLRLNVADVTDDRHGFVFHISKAKTEQSQRSVRLLTPLAIRHFMAWWVIHPRRDAPKAPLFINRYGKRARVDSTLNVLREYHNERLGRGQGTGRAPLSLYLFRKSRATHLLKEKRFNEIQIKMRLGHQKDSQMLEGYYAVIDEEDQRKAELAYIGAETEEEETPQPIPCSNCGVLNEPGRDICGRCKHPLTEEALVRENTRVLAEADERVKILHDAVDDLQRKLGLQRRKYLDETVETLKESGVLRKLISEALSEALKERHGQEA